MTPGNFPFEMTVLSVGAIENLLLGSGVVFVAFISKNVSARTRIGSHLISAATGVELLIGHPSAGFGILGLEGTIATACELIQIPSSTTVGSGVTLVKNVPAPENVGSSTVPFRPVRVAGQFPYKYVSFLERVFHSVGLDSQQITDITGCRSEGRT